jgi:hypothetical protein
LALTDLGSVISRLEAYSEMERTEDPLFASNRALIEENPTHSGTCVRSIIKNAFFGQIAACVSVSVRSPARSCSMKP